MKSIFLAVLVFALLCIFCDAEQGVSDLEVRTTNGQLCNFDIWQAIRPEYNTSCTRNYKRGIGIKSMKAVFWYQTFAYWPFCYWGNTFLDWDHCARYNWNYEFENANATTTPVKKKYYFNYYYINKNYYDAKRTCQDLGWGWDLAGCNTEFKFKEDGWIIYNDPSYNNSVNNIKEALAPMGQTFDTFWVRSDERMGCFSYDREELRSGNDGRAVKHSSCLEYRSFVCEKSV